MQIYVIFFLLAASLSANGFVTKIRVTRETHLPAPSISELISFDPPGITIIWVPVESIDEPILGYKVRIAEILSRTVMRFKRIKNKEGQEKKVLVEETDPPELNFASPKGKMFEYRIAGANQSQLKVHGIKLDTPYQINVLAYSASHDGPLSSNFGIQIYSKNATM